MAECQQSRRTLMEMVVVVVVETVKGPPTELLTAGVHSQKPHSSKPSKPICLARTTSLMLFVLFATPVAG